MARSRASRKSPPVRSSPQSPADIARALVAKFRDQVLPEALCLTTPALERTSLAEVRASRAVDDFVRRYEPSVTKQGLYAHQARVIESLRGALPNIVLTTATGSGKSLAFWSWIMDALARDRDATAVACFPTQALLWGQAQRLAAVSASDSLVAYGEQVYAGEIVLRDGTKVPWSAWHGVTSSKEMERHVDTEAFGDARLRVTTVDKVHWSLMTPREADFLKRLRCMVIDEAHYWQGLGGANVRATLDRMRLTLELMGSDAPSYFLASATLASPSEHATNLTGAARSSFTCIDDGGAARVARVSVDEAVAGLEDTHGMARRYVLMLAPAPREVGALDILGDLELVGDDANALCFVQSKNAGHRIQHDLTVRVPSRLAIAYDADMVGAERRALERMLNGGSRRGLTIAATNALELGVDIGDLDLVVMDELPPRRADLLQRLGRVGRRAHRPGLAILCLGYSPADEFLVDAPERVLSVDDMKTLPLPLHLESLKLRALRTCFAEWMPRIRKGETSWAEFNAALTRYFGWAPQYAELNEQIEAKLGHVVDLDDKSWFYKGFRVSASQGKRPLVLRRSRQPVAQINDVAVFRDAHPEGVYLGHRGTRYRVVNYRGKFRLGKWEHPESETVLGKFLHSLQEIEVEEEPRRIMTRGRWRDRFDLHEAFDLSQGCLPPRDGTLEYGAWDFVRRFDGYVETDLTGKTRPRVVTLAEISSRFKAALDAGDQFPFLHDFTYRTLGWRWRMPRALPDRELRSRIGFALQQVLHSFLCEAVECAKSDLSVSFMPDSSDLRVVDSTPGGNGLSMALLGDGRVGTALRRGQATIAKSADVPEKLSRFLVEECRVEQEIDGKELALVLEQLARAWTG